jgi:NADPH:quinone reductase-like Zn-dependent oxidoreductase
MMKAIVRDAYGSVDVLRLTEIDKPVAGEGEVLVRVQAAGVDQGVWHLMTGTPYAMRLAASESALRRTRCSGTTWPDASRRLGRG